MRKNFFLIMTLLIAAAFGFQTAAAQITITIPKLPKIKKPKVEQPTTTTTTSGENQTVQSQTSGQKTSSQTSDDDEKLNPVFIFELDEIAKITKQVDKYTPEDKLYLVNAPEGEWLLRAVSMRAREEWAKDRWTKPIEKKKLAAALDALAASAAGKLPAYKADLNDYKFHNAAEEKMMKGVLTRPADYKIFSVGLLGSSWAIDKNSLGIPTARFKNGAIYLKDLTQDHPYCYLTYVNIIQDYAGGGTYGASYTVYVRDKLVGCP